MTETTEDLTCGYLQVGSILIAAEGPVISWGALRPATPGEALLASRYPAFWLDGTSDETYVREYPKRMSHLLARVVPAAQVLGDGELRVSPDMETKRTASVVIVGPDVNVLVSARQFGPLTSKAQEGYLTEQMWQEAEAFAAAHGYRLSGVWQHYPDGSHRTGVRAREVTS